MGTTSGTTGGRTVRVWGLGALPITGFRAEGEDLWCETALRVCCLEVFRVPAFTGFWVCRPGKTDWSCLLTARCRRTCGGVRIEGERVYARDQQQFDEISARHRIDVCVITSTTLRGSDCSISIPQNASPILVGLGGAFEAVEPLMVPGARIAW